MKRAAGVLVVLAVVGLLGYGLTTKARTVSVDEALSRGEALPAPGFELVALRSGSPRSLGAVWSQASADGRVRLEELRGAPVVLNFWASWCDPCRAEIGLLERRWRDVEPAGVLVLGINQQDARDDALAFLADRGVTFPSVRDPGKETARAWGVTGTPETFFVSADGDVVAHVIGTISDEQMTAGLAAARSGRPAGVRTGGARRPTR
ncbi:MAG TPA: TlpA disulfide reductase family protein [Microbacterium sp.]|nr:TlpA disulfide reductase family protein [Microbacterium sp.]